jgi:cell wall-associated NlpC family hydrolase
VALIATCVLLLVPTLAIAAASGGINLSTPTSSAVADIPHDYLLLYQEAGLAFDVPWEVLAGIGKVECDHGQNPDPACWKEGVENAAGAGGPMQFLATTWQEYGIVASGSGAPDRWNAADAIISAANFLKSNGAPDNIEAAVFAYNHAEAYVQQVLAWANLYANAYGSNGGVSQQPPAAAQAPSSAAQAAIAYALAQLGTPYRWGGEGAGGFDCSGLVQAAYAAAGVALPRVAQAQYDAGPPVPAGEPLEPGDLVFFGAGPTQVDHVGVVLSPGEMIDAPHTGAVVRVEPFGEGSGYIGATRPAAARQ